MVVQPHDPFASARGGPLSPPVPLPIPPGPVSWLPVELDPPVADVVPGFDEPPPPPAPVAVDTVEPADPVEPPVAVEPREPAAPPMPPPPADPVDVPEPPAPAVVPVWTGGVQPRIEHA